MGIISKIKKSYSKVDKKYFGGKLPGGASSSSSSNSNTSSSSYSSVGGYSKVGGGAALVTPSGTEIGSAASSVTPSSSSSNVSRSNGGGGSSSSTGGLSTIGGQKVLVTPSGEIVGSASTNQPVKVNVPQSQVIATPSPTFSGAAESFKAGDYKFAAGQAYGAFVNKLSQEERNRLARQERNLRTGKFNQTAETPGIRSGRGTSIGMFQDYTAEELSSIPGPAAAKVLQETIQKELNDEATIIINKNINQYRPEFEQRQTDLYNNLQNAVNDGTYSVEEANKLLENGNKKLENEYKRKVTEVTNQELKPIENAYNERAKKLGQKQNIGSIAVKVPGLVASTFAAGVVIGAAPAVVGRAASVGFGLATAASTSKSAYDLQSGQITPAQFGVGLGELGITAISGGVGAKVGSKLIPKNTIANAVERAKVTAKVTNINSERIINKLELQEYGLPDIQTIKQSGMSVRYVETSLKPGRAGDGKYLPDVKGKFIEFIDQNGNVIRRQSIGQVVAEGTRTQYSSDIIRQAEGKLTESGGKLEEMSLVSTKQTGKKGNIEAYKTLEEVNLGKPEINPDGSRLQLYSGSISQVGGTIKSPKPLDIFNLKYSKAPKKPLGQISGYSIDQPKMFIQGVTPPKANTLFAGQVNIRAGRGYGIFKPQLDKPPINSLVSSKPPKKVRRGILEAKEPYVEMFAKIEQYDRNRFQNKINRLTDGSQQLFQKTTNTAKQTSENLKSLFTGSAKVETRKTAGNVVPELEQTRIRTRTRSNVRAGSLLGTQIGPSIKSPYKNISLPKTKSITSLGFGLSPISQQITKQNQIVSLRTKQNQIPGLGTGFTTATSLSTGRITPPPPITRFGSLDKAFGIDYGKKGTKSKKKSPKYQASVGSILAGGPKLKLTKQQYKKLSTYQFSGTELRPEIIITK